MAHGDAQEGKWRGNWRMECVASTLTLSRNMVYPALLTLMRTPRLPTVDWTDAPADLNGLVRFGERWNLVSARVPSRFKRSLISNCMYLRLKKNLWFICTQVLESQCWNLHKPWASLVLQHRFAWSSDVNNITKCLVHTGDATVNQSSQTLL